MTERATGEVATAIGQRKTATISTLITVTTQASATKIITNSLTARRMRADIERATSVVAAGAGINCLRSEKPCGGAWLFC